MKMLNADDMLKNTQAMKAQFDAIEIDGIIKYIEERAQEGDWVDIIRCKDCQNCYTQDDYEYWCIKQCPSFLVKREGFCSEAIAKRAKEAKQKHGKTSK